MSAPLEHPRELQLAQLRQRIAAVPGQGKGARRRTERPGKPPLLPVPAALEPLLPRGGLVRGSVVSYAGSDVLLSGLLAAVTGDGGHAAVIGRPRLGLLAAVEMGARLDRLAVVPDPGSDPVEVAAILLDGMDLVVLGLGGVSVAPSRTRVLAARARSRGATLLVVDGRWSGSELVLTARVVGYRGLGRGYGRLCAVQLEVTAQGRSTPLRRARLSVEGDGDRTRWRADDPVQREMRHPRHVRECRIR